MRNLFFILIILLSLSAKSQVLKDRIDANYINTPLIEVLNDFEKRLDIKFYYQPAFFKNITITETFNKLPLKQCLAQLFKKHFFNFHFLSSNQIVIYSGLSIRNSLLTYIDRSKEEAQEQAEKTATRRALERLQYKIFDIGTPGAKNKKAPFFSGRLTSFENGKPIAGANVFISGTNRGVSTDKNGYFNLPLCSGNYVIKFTSLGMQETQRIINFYSAGKLDVMMDTQINFLNDIDIFGDRQGNVDRTAMGVESLNIKEFNSIPSLLGEPDVMKGALMLPGVQAVGEGTAGFNVRGGKSDQNLILIDNAPIYAPSHLFGNFSAINADAVKEATMYKGSIPARHGGRLSSVYEINTKDGNNKQIHGAGGVSPMSARFMIEGPIKKDKLSFLFNARSTYSDWVLKSVKTTKLLNSSANFYDGQLKFTYQLNKKHKITANSYLSDDRFQLRSDTTYQYKNLCGNIAWKYIVNQTLQINTSLIYSKYSYTMSDRKNPEDDFQLRHQLDNWGIKSDIIYNYQDHLLTIGAISTLYNIDPGKRTSRSTSKIRPYTSDRQKGIESAVYIGDEFSLSPKITLEAGLRLSSFLSLKDGEEYKYASNSPLSATNIIDTIQNTQGAIDKLYLNPEYRFAAKYLLSASSSVKFSFNKSTQYLHLLTNSTAISPTDSWTLSNKFIKPQIGHQFSLGYFKNYQSGRFEISAELYYKSLKNIKEFKPGASLLLNDHIETELLDGKGRSYGFEFSIKRNIGRIFGMLNYTYSKTELKATSPYPEEQVNGGKYFPASYDRPHSLNLLANLKLSRRVTFSTNVVYNSGRPITYPTSKYKMGNQIILNYTEYNQFRIPDYYRLDLSLKVEGNLKRKKLAHSSLVFSLYNVTARKNAYSVYFRSEGRQINGYKLSIFGATIPTITYNFRF